MAYFAWIFTTVILSIVFCTTATAQELSPIVTLPNQGGGLQGIIKTSRNGLEYYAYLTIPYVERPTRFRESVRHGGWTGVRNATQDIPICPQMSGGTEDCLFLNVYTPNNLNPATPYATIVHIHGGGFTAGGALWYGEKYIMDEEVIFVNINYRIGTLGYLNTGDGASDANVASKDQRQALLWVRDNIHVFGGNNQNITLLGGSGGALSIHYLMLSPTSEGLFQKAILGSLSAEAPLAYNRNPREYANQLAIKMSCPTDNTTAMVQCLQGKGAYELVSQNFDRPNWPFDSFPFGTSVEWEGSPNRFIVEDPIVSMKNGRFHKIPVLFGAVKNESLSLQVPVILRNPSMLRILNEDWNSIAPHTFFYENIIPQERWDEVSQKIKSFYFGDKIISNDTAFELEQVYNDITFLHWIRQSILNIAKQGVPVYPFFLDFEQEGAGYPGVPHGVDYRYFFSTYPDPITLIIDEGLEPNSTAEAFSKNVVKLFVSFAKTGQPVSTWGGVVWPRTSLAEGNGDTPLRWLHLNQELTLESETADFTNRMKFWDEVFTHSGSVRIRFSVIWLFLASILSTIILTE